MLTSTRIPKSPKPAKVNTITDVADVVENQHKRTLSGKEEASVRGDEGVFRDPPSNMMGSESVEIRKKSNDAESNMAPYGEPLELVTAIG